MRRAFLPALVVLIAAALAPPATLVHAQDSPAPRARGELDREIAHLSAERDRLAREEQGVIGRLERLEAEARLQDARVEALRVDERAAVAALESAQAEHDALRARLESSRAELRETVRALWRVGPLARLRPLLEAADAEKMAGALRLAREISRRQHQQVATVRDDEARLALLRAELEAREVRLAALRDEAQEVRARLAASIAERRALLARIREDAEIRESAVAELQRAKNQLDAIIGGLEAPAPLELDVRNFRGLLSMPVAGTVVRAFGDRRDPRFGTRIPHPGWDLAADFGERVRPVFDGKVVFADWFRGYGLMVVVDHGRGVHSVYAHLSAILAPVGTEVTRETVLGRVGDTGSLAGPHLYLEIRRDGKAEDPARWLRRTAP